MLHYLARPETVSSSPHRLIAIEDNHADCAILREALNQVGEPYTLQILPDGESALRYVGEHCRSDSPEPCLIILDLHLPFYDGSTILRAIRETPELSHVSIAVLTTIASPRERDEVLRLGVQLYRTKPMSWLENVELARELIELCKNPRTFAAQS